MNLNGFLNVKYDFEIIAQKNLMNILKQGMNEKEITKDKCDSLGRTLVHQCCIFGNFEMLDYLVQMWGESCLSVPDKYNVTTTHFIARNGDVKLLEYLIAKKKLSNEREIRFETSALDLSIAMKHDECSDLLIKYANQSTLNRSLLNVCNEGNLKLVEKLIENGANIECKMQDTGSTPLDRAAYNGHFHVVSYLLKKGSQVDNPCSNQTTPLYHAAFHGYPEIVDLLIQYGANPNIVRSTDQTTPLYVSCFLGKLEIIHSLLKAGADPNARCTNDLCTPLYLAAQTSSKQVAQLLLRYKADPNIPASDNCSPLVIAAFKGFKEVTLLLLEHGADQGILFGGFDAAFWAKSKGHEELCKLLNHYKEKKMAI